MKLGDNGGGKSSGHGAGDDSCHFIWCPRDPQGAQLLPDQRSHQPGPSLQEDIANFRVLVKLLPVMVTLVPYWMVYFQVGTPAFLLWEGWLPSPLTGRIYHRRSPGCADSGEGVHKVNCCSAAAGGGLAQSHPSS